jgi:pyruvate dehydrogenase E2 component (dihydrolipoamide acetyltransferase)
MMMASRHAVQRVVLRAAAAVGRAQPSAAALRAPQRLVDRRANLLAAWFSSFPDHDILPMPALSPTMVQGNLGSWTLKVGDKVIPGNSVAEIETDKASVAFEAQDEGYIAALLHKDGTQDIAVGTPIAVVVSKASDVAAFANFTLADALGQSGGAAAAKPAAAPAAPAGAAPAPAKTTAAAASAATAAAPGARVFASPLARKVAREAGITVSGVAGSGPNGRVTRKDVEAFLAVRARGRIVCASGCRFWSHQHVVVLAPPDRSVEVSGSVCRF